MDSPKPIDLSQSKYWDPIENKMIRVVKDSNGMIIQIEADNGGTGYLRTYLNNKIQTETTYKNYQLSTKKIWDTSGNLVKNEWHITSSDMLIPVMVISILLLIIWTWLNIKKKRKRNV